MGNYVLVFYVLDPFIQVQNSTKLVDHSRADVPLFEAGKNRMLWRLIVF